MFNEPRFWTAVAFVLFFLLFGRKLWRIIATRLDERAELVRNNLDESARLRREAEQMLEDATRERENAAAEAQQLIEASEAQALSLKERALRDSEELVSRHEKLARDRIKALENAALRDIRNKAADVAFAASREAITEILQKDSNLAAQLLDQSLTNIPKALKQDNAA
ncbi:F0F1 ATP synthase subunit B [Aristophania vespae]|uniref:ATP synthase subunit b n=1 Tax=Aristophania vespae TaxID=2697033 RepID=A0A6P1NGE7_9PROT|nr:F0F1 ATP synthase subunit B [Aristophania vespae]QHI96303.1 F0F1 ATP synthase subunit B [Aristophania vespae]QHI96463.1 F0F1 ATP synthase subunit B [Aristophania vespae]